MGVVLTVSTPAGRPYHHGGLDHALLGAARELLAEGGVEALSLRAIARRAGVSPMAPYRHYPDKEHLLAAVAAQGFAAFSCALRNADETAPPGEALVAQAVAYVQFALANPAMFRLMFGAPRLGGHPELAAAGDSAYGVLASRVAAEAPDGADSEARTLGCWSMVHGLALLFLDAGLAGKVSASPDEITRRVAAVMLTQRRQVS